MSIYGYESIAIGMVFGPLVMLAGMEIWTHIQWMREQRSRRDHPTNRINER